MSGETLTTDAAIATRRHSRYAVSGRITCELIPVLIRATLLNVSGGGCLLQSPLRYRVGDVARFRFTVEAERDAIYVLRAKVVHATAVPADSSYLVGLEFLDEQTSICRRAIEHLLAVVAR